MRRLLETLAALVLKRVLGTARTVPAAPVAAARSKRREVPPMARPGMARLALGMLALGSLMLVVFDAWFTRLIGVMALFAFIVAGVFAIATAELLEGEEELTP